MNKSVMGSLVLVPLMLGFAGCATTQEMGEAPGTVLAEGQEAEPEAKASKQKRDNKPVEGILNQPVPKVSGPKRSVAVGKFDAIGAFRQKYGDWDIGGGLSAMLTTALVESKRFIILERANIGQVLTEQELKGQKVVVQGSGPELGKVIGAQLLIYGSVTEFDESEKGGGFSLGMSGGGLGSLFGGSLSPQHTRGKVAMDIRVVDTTTSEVLETHRVEESVSSTSFDISFDVEGMSLGTNAFFKTPLGKATRQAINRAVQLIARDAEKAGWSGRVVDYDGQELYINAGSQSGVKIGDRFVITRVVKKFTDPDTGKVLGTRKKDLGILQLKSVERKLSSGAFFPLDDQPPQRGDLVVVRKGNKG